MVSGWLVSHIFDRIKKALKLLLISNWKDIRSWCQLCRHGMALQSIVSIDKAVGVMVSKQEAVTRISKMMFSGFQRRCDGEAWLTGLYWWLGFIGQYELVWADHLIQMILIDALVSTIIPISSPHLIYLTSIDPISSPHLIYLLSSIDSIFSPQLILFSVLNWFYLSIFSPQLILFSVLNWSYLQSSFDPNLSPQLILSSILIWS